MVTCYFYLKFSAGLKRVSSPVRTVRKERYFHMYIHQCSYKNKSLAEIVPFDRSNQHIGSENSIEIRFFHLHKFSLSRLLYHFKSYLAVANLLVRPNVVAVWETGHASSYVKFVSAVVWKEANKLENNGRKLNKLDLMRRGLNITVKAKKWAWPEDPTAIDMKWIRSISSSYRLQYLWYKT